MSKKTEDSLSAKTNQTKLQPKDLAQSSFLVLLNDVRTLHRDLDNRATFGEGIVQVLTSELTLRIPKALKDTNLSFEEIIIIGVIIIDQRPCRDLIREVLSILCSDFESALRSEIELRNSVGNGNLKNYLAFDGDRFELKPEKFEEIYQLFLNNKEA